MSAFALMLGYKRTHVERRETDVFDPIRTSRSSDRVPESGIPAYHRPQPITNSGDTSAVAVVDYPALKMQVQTLAKRGRSHPQCVGSHASATEIVANVAGGGFAAYLDVRTQGNRQSVTIRPQSGTQGQSHYSWQLGPKRSEPSQRTDFWCRRCSMRTKSLPPILTPRASGSPREQTRLAHLGGASGWRRFANPYPRNTREECAGASQVPARCTATRRMAGLHGYDSQRLGHYLDLDATNHWLSLIKLIGMASKL
jgi:hypothetical protein